MESALTWREGMAFDVELDGHTFPIDADEAAGGRDRGPRPKGLLLAALAGCAGMDVIAILGKMRQSPASLRMQAEGRLTEEHPRVLEDLVLTVEAEGEVDAGKLWRAVALSRDRYCGVAAMLRRAATITYRVRLNGAEIPEPS